MLYDIHATMLKLICIDKYLLIRYTMINTFKNVIIIAFMTLKLTCIEKLGKYLNVVIVV